MTRLPMVLFCVSALAIPVSSLCGNIEPKLLLEVFSFEAEPDPVPDYVCVHAVGVGPQELPCYAPRIANNAYYIALHLIGLDSPICPAPGPGCVDFGGYLGVPFGVSQTGGSPMLTFISWNACPGFLKGPSNAGEPAACLASATAVCHGDLDHEGYLVYLNAGTSTIGEFFNIVNNADLGYVKVINCNSTYDENTFILGGVQIGGTQSIFCPFTPVQELTWGKIKGLFR